MHQPCVSPCGALLRAAVGEKREQDRENHEDDGRAEHPVRHILVHDPAKQERADNAAVAMMNTMAALIAKQAAATWPWRRVRSARKPPASTPTVLKPRNAVSAILADENDAP